jgi:uncharacterized protein YgfB (UPF0149 family)
MKKIILSIVVVLISLTTYAQTSMFDKFEDMNGVSSVIVNKEAFKMLAKFKGGGEEGQEYLEMVQNLNSFKVFTTENAQVATQMTDAMNTYLSSAKLTELMRVKDDETNVKIYIRQGKDVDHVSELLMFVNGAGKYTKDSGSPIKAETVILSLTGDIDLNKISKLTETHIPNSGKQLKQQ